MNTVDSIKLICPGTGQYTKHWKYEIEQCGESYVVTFTAWTERPASKKETVPRVTVLSFETRQEAVNKALRSMNKKVEYGFTEEKSEAA